MILQRVVFVATPWSLNQPIFLSGKEAIKCLPSCSLTIMWGSVNIPSHWCMASSWTAASSCFKSTSIFVSAKLGDQVLLIFGFGFGGVAFAIWQCRKWSHVVVKHCEFICASKSFMNHSLGGETKQTHHQRIPQFAIVWHCSFVFEMGSFLHFSKTPEQTLFPHPHLLEFQPVLQWCVSQSMWSGNTSRRTTLG